MIASPLTSKNTAMRDLEGRKVRDVNPPFYYHIHLYMPCNQKCIMCVPDGRHPKDAVPFNKFEDFVNQVRPHAEHITLMGGETLLYPWMSEALALLADYGLAVTIVTNATMLNEPMILKLLTLRELNLRCSIDAATPETYEKIRGTNMFARVTQNMKLFSDMASDYPRHRQILVYVVMRENLHEVLPFVDLAATMSPYKVHFNPVRHVSKWVVENGTGWTFKGLDQSCESFKNEYNSIMEQAAEKCTRAGLRHEIMLLQ